MADIAFLLFANVWGTQILQKDDMVERIVAENPYAESELADLELGCGSLHQNDLDVSYASHVSADSPYTHIKIPHAGRKIDEETETGGGGSSSRREVPLFCAVCLKEYRLCDKVSWSQNPKCPHNFHTDCIRMWFAAIARRGEKSLDCHMCRQVFLDNPRTEGVDF